MTDTSTESFHDPAHYAGYDGYDCIGLTEKDGWHVYSSWGRDGWDLGDWPYVWYARKGRQVKSWCEGDITITTHATEAEALAKLDEYAEWHWRRQPDRGPSDLPAGTGLSDHHRGPFSWARLNAETANG